MINFRYHIVSLAAVLFALAAGVALGAGVLHDSHADDGGLNATNEISPQLVGFDAGFASITADDLLSGTLKDRTVLLVSLPNTREAEINGIAENIRLAGAEITGHIRFTSTLLDPAKKQFVEGIATQANQGVSSPNGSYGVIGSTMAKAYVDARAREAGEAGKTIRAAFVEGELIENIKEPGRKADLVMLVSGAPRDSDADQGDIVALLVSELDPASKGVVVAGPISSGESGVVSDIRASDAAAQVSTIDVTDLASGRIAAVLALQREFQGKGGSWGTTRSADGPVPN